MQTRFAAVVSANSADLFYLTPGQGVGDVLRQYAAQGVDNDTNHMPRPALMLKRMLHSVAAMHVRSDYEDDLWLLCGCGDTEWITATYYLVCHKEGISPLLPGPVGPHQPTEDPYVRAERMAKDETVTYETALMAPYDPATDALLN